MKKFIFRNMTPLATANVSRCFGRTYRLHLHGRKASQANKQQQAEQRPPSQYMSWPFRTRFALLAACYMRVSCLTNFFDPEDGSDTDLRNVVFHRTTWENTEVFNDIFRNAVRFPAGARNVVGHPASYPMGAGGSFGGGKAVRALHGDLTVACIYICGIFKEAGSNSAYKLSNDCVMINSELERTRNEVRI
jgi:hypothetical protein